MVQHFTLISVNPQKKPPTLKSPPRLSPGNMAQMQGMETSIQTLHTEQSYKLLQRGCPVMENVMQDELEEKLPLV